MGVRTKRSEQSQRPLLARVTREDAYGEMRGAS